MATLTCTEEANKAPSCEECGLPISACNALAFFRRSAVRYQQGKIDQGNEWFDEAEAEYKRYMDGRK